jgi:hypothetical protein
MGVLLKVKGSALRPCAMSRDLSSAACRCGRRGRSSIRAKVGGVYFPYHNFQPPKDLFNLPCTESLNEDGK